MAYEIGSTEVEMADLALLDEPVDYPRGEYEPYAVYKRLGSGAVQGYGLPVARWNFAVLTSEQRDQLKEFCSGASATVFISTKNNEGDFVDFEAIMVWPEQEQRWPGGHFKDLVIEFRQLEALT